MQLCGRAEMKQKNDELMKALLNVHVCSLYLINSSQQVHQHIPTLPIDFFLFSRVPSLY